MRIGNRLIISFLVIAISISIVGIVSTFFSQNALEQSITESSKVLAAEIMDTINRNFYYKLEAFELFSQDPILHEVLRESNKEFEQIDDIENFMDVLDQQWLSIPKEDVSPFMESLINNNAANKLREFQSFYEERYGYNVIGEIFVTNAYGANVAQTGKTTDYKQSDEDWWKQGKQYDVWVKDVEYDESADVFSNDYVIRIDDENGNMLGVMKVVLNVEEIFNILEVYENSKEFDSTHYVLLDRNQDILFPQTLNEHSFMESINFKETNDSDFNIFSGQKLLVKTESIKFRDFEGFNWSILIVHDAEQVLKPVLDLRNLMIVIFSIIVFLTVIVGWYIARSISKPTSDLQEAIQRVKKGEYDASAKISSNDEIGDLSKSFDNMTQSLIQTEILHKAAVKKYKDLYENSSGLHRTINLDGKIINCNKSYALAFGYRKEEIIGKSIFDFCPKENLNDMQDSFESWKKTGRSQGREIIFQRKDGSLFPGLLSATNLYDEQGNLLGSNTVIQDLSDIRNAQKEIQELQTKRLSVIGELTARIAHDMRNPLSVIKNSAELIKIQQKKMNQQTLSQWDRLERGIFRISHQVDDVLDYVRKPVIKKQNIKFSIILKNTLSRCEIPKNIKIIKPKKDANIFCDSNKFEIVLVNLIMNAVQAMSTHKGNIDISFSKNSENKITSIKISDTGFGIPPKLINKIFDPLFTTREIGTGLGLPSCKNIIEHHRGTIEVNSTEGEGSTFIIKLLTETEWEEINKIGNKEKLTDFIVSLNSNL